MTQAPVKITRDLTHPEAAGKYHRIICMTGRNKGLCYYLKDLRVIMGRSNQADIQIVDTQSSREHLEIVLVGKNYVLTDLGSQNGVTVNDLKITQHKLKSGDKIIIGTTVFKFGVLDVLPIVVTDEDEDEEEEEEEVVKPKRKRKAAKASPEAKRKKLIYIVVIIGAIMMFLPDSKEATKKKVETDNGTAFIDREVKRNYKSEVEKEITSKVKAYIHRGRREAREKNYFRAMEEFSLALMLDPKNGDAAFHMNKAKQRLDEKVEAMFLYATKLKDSLKFNQAKGTYCAIYKLLIEYPEDARFKEAQKSVEDMSLNKLGMDESENYCF